MVNKPHQSLTISHLPFDWRLGLGLVVLVCVPRFFMVLHANVAGSYMAISVVMVISALIPFILLSRTGRMAARIKGTNRYGYLLLALITGFLFAYVLGWIGQLVYGQSTSNWYRYIGRTFKIPAGISAPDKLVYFTIFAITGMIFSPIGEELFFRGIVHSSFAESFGEKRASIIDSGAFALTHLAHFGLIWSDGVWRFVFLPALIWVTAMFLASKLFYYWREKCSSIIGAIVAHAGFNVGMTCFIFYG